MLMMDVEVLERVNERVKELEDVFERERVVCEVEMKVNVVETEAKTKATRETFDAAKRELEDVCERLCVEVDEVNEKVEMVVVE